MKNVLVLIFGFLMMSISYAQQVKSHKVAKGENVFRIAKRYNTTTEEIYRANPSAKDGIDEGEILVIPIKNNEEFKVHTVEEGDTVYNLSKKFGITEETIYKLNPDAVNGINVGQILRVGVVVKATNEPLETSNDGQNVIPLEDDRKVVGYKTHKVRKKETLFSIAETYKVTIDDIKKYNKRLYSEQIRKKDKLRIPIYEKVAPVAEVPKQEILLDSLGNRVSQITKYIVKPKETKYSIARRHGITMEELDRLNPTMDPNFPIGMEIAVPTIIFVPLEETIDLDKFELYEVPPQETIFSILKRTKISSDSLFKMNPYLIDGLRAGMVITLPKSAMNAVRDSLSIDFQENMPNNLEKMLSNYKKKNIAVMLPFGLDSIDIESRSETEEYLKDRRKSQGMRIALDFYKGVRIAVDSAKGKGLSVEMSVYDTQVNKSSWHIKKLISENNFDELDAVIGPLYQANVETVAAELKKYDIPVFSPISNKESKLYGNFFQTIPTDLMLQDKLLSYIKKDSTNKNIILVVQQGKRHEKIKEKLVAEFPEAKVAIIEEGNYLYEVNLDKVLKENMPNWVILESNDVAMISNVTTLLTSRVETHQVTLFTTDKNTKYDDDSIKNEYLSKLHLHYPSIYKEYDHETKIVTSFVERYRKKYGTIPNKYAVRGFDITYDILMRLGSADDLYHSASIEGTTEYVENKFNYAKKLLGGYYNKASYLMKFDDDLKLTIIE